MVRLSRRTALRVETDLKDQAYFAFRLLILRLYYLGQRHQGFSKFAR